ncbi:phenylalanine--tRNA ligase subunit beta, partial [Hallella bergensis]|uniref:phenylalanine--tRNA ligase subunit beta n=1 Tax=Hallella bergensis TaxID=242750 RepID=UPI003990BFA9
VLESAYFHPTWIRKSARRHGLSTDSSFRFERGIDPNGQIYALKQAAILCKKLSGGQVSMQIKDVYPEPLEDFKVNLQFEYCDRLIGKQIGNDTIKNIVQSLGIKIEHEDHDGLQLLVPAYRVDVQRPCDVVEEILRIYGYNNIEIPTILKSSLTVAGDQDKEHQLENIVSEQLVGCGFNEIINNSLTKSSYYNSDSVSSYPWDNTVKLMNPLSADLGVMRQTLLYGGLESLARNINRKRNNLKFFELGNVYKYSAEKENDQSPVKAYSQEYHLGMWITGKRVENSWVHRDEESSFYELKAYVENVFMRLGISKSMLVTTKTKNNIFAYRLTQNSRNGQVLVEFGKLSRSVLHKFDIDNDVFYAEFNWAGLMKAIKKNKVEFTELNKYPSVSRDLALLVDENIEFAQIEEIAHQTEKKLLKQVKLFDVYQGKNLPEGKKSYAVNFTLEDDAQTLTDNKIDSIMKKLIKNLTSKLGAELR